MEGVDEGEYLSQDIRGPKAITAITYQALHSAMRRLKGTLKETWDEEESFLEEVDFSDYDILKTIQEAGIEVICLDECHHLRSEWWKALEDFVAMTGEKTMISLTATPPYDSNVSQWERYIKLCGEIDEEITVPELVKEGSLCPHQDFVYFNYPTKEEKKVIDSFKDNAKIRTKKLLLDEGFAKIIASHIGLNNIENAGERFLEDPSYLSAILIFLKEKGMNFSPYLLELLGVKQLPGMKEKWMELLLQGVLYDDRESYYADSAYLEQLETKLKHEGLVDKRKVTLVTNSKVEKLLISSKGKVESIKQIVRTEYEALHSELRMLILTDYIKKEYLSYIGKEEKECSALGVIPFFEVLRREHSKGLKLGVLCGSVVILPTEAKERLEQLLEESRGSCSTIETLPNKDYIQAMCGTWYVCTRRILI